MPNSLLDQLQLYVSLVRYSNAHNQDFANAHYAFFADMQRNLKKYGVDDVRGLRLLDVGCGKSAWLTLLLHSYGANVTGIDTEFVGLGLTLEKYMGLIRQNGPERAFRTFGWDLAFAGPYYRALADVCPFPLCFEGVDARQTGVAEVDFADNTFDLVVSHEVFEHIPDLPGAVQALHRVMKPEGITYIYVHNFASISGGHHLAWKYPDTEPSDVVPPWDHLRQNLYPDIPSWINRLRERDYRQAFETRFEILDWISTAREGETLLTPEIRSELADYSEAELLTKGFVIVARPKK